MSDKIIAMLRRNLTAIHAWDKDGYVGEWMRIKHFGGWRRVIARINDVSHCDGGGG